MRADLTFRPLGFPQGRGGERETRQRQTGPRPLYHSAEGHRDRQEPHRQEEKGTAAG
jgi:hypothetical protein